MRNERCRGDRRNIPAPAARGHDCPSSGDWKEARRWPLPLRPFLVDRLERQPADIIQRDGHALRRVADREADGRELRLPLEDEIGDLHVGIARHAAAVAAIRLAVALRVVPGRTDGNSSPLYPP